MARKRKKSLRSSGSKNVSTKSKMLNLAKRVLRDDSIEARSKLFEMALKQIENGNDQVFLRAMEATDDLEKQEVLEKTFEDAVCNLDVVATNDEGFHPIDSRLFVIPIIGVMEGGFNNNSLTEDDLLSMTTCMRNNGVVKPEDSIILLPEFHTINSLEDGFVDTYKLHKAIINHQDVVAQMKLHESVDRSKQSFSVERSTLSLRFLVGVVIGEDVFFPDDTVSLMENLDEENEDEIEGLIDRQYMPDLEGWYKEASDIISGYLSKGYDVHTELPSSYYQGIREGASFFQKMAATTTFSLALRNQNIDPSELELRVALLEDDFEANLMLCKTNGSPIEAVNWSIPDFYESTMSEVTDGIIEIAQDIGVRINYSGSDQKMNHSGAIMH